MEYSFKIILVGETGVGCRQLSNITSGKGFIEGQQCCILWDFIERALFIKNKEYKIKLWSGPGQQSFRGLNKFYLKNSNIVIFVYDITNRNTFLELNYHINRAIEVLGDKFIGAIVGNKVDLKNDAKITEEEAEQLANKYGYKFKLVSAKCDPESFISFLKELCIDYLKDLDFFRRNKTFIGIERIKKERKNYFERKNNLKRTNFKLFLSKYFNY